MKVKASKNERVIVRANGGFFVATYIEEESDGAEAGGHEFVMDPVIAWLVEVHEEENVSITPLTIEGNPDTLANIWMLRDSNGKYTLPLDRGFKTEHEALDYCREQTKKERKT